jgi:alkanesulfonate monooxygenase SsuD/methylene tetrahydromethanopterin reductase-like flavin-dependent oxidoreductase (luciferase family)
MAETKTDLGNYAYAADLAKVDKSGALDLLTLEYLTGAGACALGTPDECLEACRRYEAAGVDLLLCLVNPYKIPHDKVMQTIELIGAHVIPKFR